MSNRKYRTGAKHEAPNVAEAYAGQLMGESEEPRASRQGNPLPDWKAREMLADAALLMHHLMNTCIDAITTVGTKMADHKFAEELRNEANDVANGETKVRRARPHALSGLVRFALRAAQLMIQCLQACNPDVFKASRHPEKDKALKDAYKSTAFYKELKQRLAT